MQIYLSKDLQQRKRYPLTIDYFIYTRIDINLKLFIYLDRFKFHEFPLDWQTNILSYVSRSMWLNMQSSNKRKIHTNEQKKQIFILTDAEKLIQSIVISPRKRNTFKGQILPIEIYSLANNIKQQTDRVYYSQFLFNHKN